MRTARLPTVRVVVTVIRSHFRGDGYARSHVWGGVGYAYPSLPSGIPTPTLWYTWTNPLVYQLPTSGAPAPLWYTCPPVWAQPYSTLERKGIRHTHPPVKRPVTAYPDPSLPHFRGQTDTFENITFPRPVKMFPRPAWALKTLKRGRTSPTPWTFSPLSNGGSSEAGCCFATCSLLIGWNI